VSGFGRIILFGAITATVAGIAGLRAQTQLMDPKDAPKIFASTCSACHKSPQGLAKSGQVAGFLRQHYTTGPEMSAAMAAYLVAAGSGPASRKGQATAQSVDHPAAKTKGKKQEQAAATPADHAGTEAKDRSLRGKQRHTKSQDEPPALRPAQPAAPEPATRQAAAPAAGSNETPAAATAAVAVPAPEPAGPPLVVFDLPLPAMPEVPPPELTHSAFSSAPLP
jgi:hypothetical protein